LMAKFKAVPPAKIAEQVKAHIQAVHYAKAHHLEPAPVFRDLYNIVQLEDIDAKRSVLRLITSIIENVAANKAEEKPKRARAIVSKYAQDADKHVSNETVPNIDPRTRRPVR
jgi:lysyl-tRNA synthetase class I